MPHKKRYPSGKLSGPFPVMLFIIVLAGGVIFLNSCSVVKQAKAYDRFVQSRFTLTSARLLSVGTVDVSQKSNYNQLDFGQIVSLGMQLLKGDLPAVMEIHVKGYNPAQEEASISGTDWILLTGKDTLATGTLNKPLSIPPGKTLQFPVKARFNMGKLLASGSLQQILNVLLSGNSPNAYQKLHLAFKIRPWYRSGKKIKKSPVYITIHPHIGR